MVLAVSGLPQALTQCSPDHDRVDREHRWTLSSRLINKAALTGTLCTKADMHTA